MNFTNFSSDLIKCMTRKLLVHSPITGSNELIDEISGSQPAATAKNAPSMYVYQTTAYVSSSGINTFHVDNSSNCSYQGCMKVSRFPFEISSLDDSLYILFDDGTFSCSKNSNL